MTDRPILFSASMIRALLDGRKSQTRRVIKPQPPQWAAVCSAIFPPQGLFQWSEAEHDPPRPLKRWPEDHALRVRFAKGDRLWVRENLWLYGRWRQEGTTPKGRPRQTLDLIGKVAAFEKPADIAYWGGKAGFAFRPGIHMPRWASRLTLTVTEVRVQRLQECSKEDAAAEGLIKLPATGRYVIAKGDQYFDKAHLDPRVVYSWLWDEINGVGAWAANPWIVALTFTSERRNIDAC